MNKFNFFSPFMYNDERDFITKYLDRDDILLEWGSGNSTIYFSGIVKKVISIEHDISFFNYVKKTINFYDIDNVDIVLIPSDIEVGIKSPNKDNYEEYISYIEYPSKNDLKFTKVLIDGRARNYCASSILNMINDNTIVFVHDFNNIDYHKILDNYDIIDRLSNHSNMGIVSLKKIK